MDTATQAKQKSILCVARHKGTRVHGTREQPMDTGPKRDFPIPYLFNNFIIKVIWNTFLVFLWCVFGFFICFFTCYIPIIIIWWRIRITILVSLESANCSVKLAATLTLNPIIFFISMWPECYIRGKTGGNTFFCVWARRRPPLAPILLIC